MFNFEPYVNILPNVLIAFLIGLLITPLLRKIGLRYGFSTKGKGLATKDDRGFETRTHTGVMSRLGEFAVLIPVFLLMWQSLNLNVQVFGIVMSLGMMGIIGAFDAKYDLSEFVKLSILLFVSILLIFTGTVIDIHSIIDLRFVDFFINNPLNGSQLSLLGSLVTIAWIMIISTAVSYVGGVDGLGEGTCAIAIMILTLIGVRNGDVLTVTLGSLALGGMLGLLPYNFHPAVIYSEHLTYGFLIAILSIISKGKITASVLLLTVPLLDFIYVTYLRSKKYFEEQDRFSIKLFLHYLGGRGGLIHLHHRMMKIVGNNPVKISLIQYIAYGVLGVIALAVSSLYLTLAIVSSFALFVLIFILINRYIKNGQSKL